MALSIETTIWIGATFEQDKVTTMVEKSFVYFAFHYYDINTIIVPTTDTILVYNKLSSSMLTLILADLAVTISVPLEQRSNACLQFAPQMLLLGTFAC